MSDWWSMYGKVYGPATLVSLRSRATAAAFKRSVVFRAREWLAARIAPPIPPGVPMTIILNSRGKVRVRL